MGNLIFPMKILYSFHAGCSPNMEYYTFLSVASPSMGRCPPSSLACGSECKQVQHAEGKRRAPGHRFP